MKRPVLLLAASLLLAGCGAAQETDTPRLADVTPAIVASTTATSGAPVAGLTVKRVIDGDTLTLSDGTTIRLLGIDTPERGQCGYTQATANLSRLTEGKTVTLTRGGRTDRDRYSRLIRYVTAGRVDVGLEQIRAGLATARYDSRDGYGRHTREPEYVAADAKAGNPHCPMPSKTANPAPTTRAAPVQLKQDSRNTAARPVPVPRKTPQTPARATTAPQSSGGYVKNCADARARGIAPLHRGAPGYRAALDRDGDGVACER